MSGPSARWSAPVDFNFPLSGAHKVGGPFEALVHMTEQWPAVQGPNFEPEAPAERHWQDTNLSTRLASLLKLRWQKRVIETDFAQRLRRPMKFGRA